MSPVQSFEINLKQNTKKNQNYHDIDVHDCMYNLTKTYKLNLIAVKMEIEIHMCNISMSSLSNKKSR